MSAKKAEKTTTRVIALVSKPNELKFVFDQLRARNILIFPAPNVEAAMKVLESGVVEFCLLSVDHPSVDIYAWPQEIENKLRIPVIAISELRDKQSMWRLTKVRVKNILYSKATAPSIFARIELIKKVTLAQRASKMPDVSKSIMIDPNQKKEGGSLASRRAQKLKDRFAEDRKQKPKTNFSPLTKPIGSVTLTEAKYTFLRPAEEESPKEIVRRHREFMEFFGAELREAHTSVEEESSINILGSVGVEDTEHKSSVIVEDSLSDVAPLSEEGIASEDTQKVIIHCLRTVIAEFCNPNALTKEAKDFSNTMVISINSKSLTGTFLIAEQFTKSNLNDLQEQLYKYLRSFGFDWNQQEIAVQILNDLKVPAEVINSGVYVSGIGQQGEMALSYYQEAIEIPELSMPEDMKYYFDPKVLVKNTEVNFDVYLHLRVNSKDLQYVKLGSVITEKQIAKLSSSAAIPWVPKQQLSNITEYILLQRLWRMIKGEDGQEMEDIEELLKIS